MAKQKANRMRRKELLLLLSERLRKRDLSSKQFIDLAECYLELDPFRRKRPVETEKPKTSASHEQAVYEEVLRLEAGMKKKGSTERLSNA